MGRHAGPAGQGIIHGVVMLNPLRSTYPAEGAINQAIATLRQALGTAR